MAIGWLTVLQSVPWTDVVRNAPKVAAKARKFWHSVGKKPPSSAKPATDESAVLSSDAQAVSALASRILVLEAAVADLQSLTVESTELIKALAEQNTQLILRTETLRIRMGWLAATLGLVAAASMVLVLMR